jgi:uncharacterized protein YjbJ (UPF0337 family)
MTTGTRRRARPGNPPEPAKNPASGRERRAGGTVRTLRTIPFVLRPARPRQALWRRSARPARPRSAPRLTIAFTQRHARTCGRRHACSSNRSSSHAGVAGIGVMHRRAGAPTDCCNGRWSLANRRVDQSTGWVAGGCVGGRGSVADERRYRPPSCVDGDVVGWDAVTTTNVAKNGEDMGDRAQRIKGKAEELKGRAKRESGKASGRPGTEARGAGEELKGKLRNAAGKARSAAKKATR